MDEIIARFEKMRAKQAQKGLILLLVGIAGLVFSIVSFIMALVFGADSDTARTLLFVLTLVLLFGGIGCLIAYGVVLKKWRSIFLNQILLELLNAIYPGFVFDLRGGVSQEVLMTPKFFMRPDRYFCGNLLSAKYETTAFSMSDYTLQRESRDKDGHVQYSTYAKGRFFVFTFERDFENVVKVVEKNLFGNFNFSGLEKVELESMDFNKKFMTVASDQMAAFYILTPQVQEQMMTLEKHFGGKIYFCFMKNHLYIAVDDGHNSFKYSLFTPLTKENLGKLIAEISIPKSFVDALKLNREKYNRDTTMTGI